MRPPGGPAALSVPAASPGAWSGQRLQQRHFRLRRRRQDRRRLDRLLRWIERGRQIGFRLLNPDFGGVAFADQRRFADLARRDPVADRRGPAIFAAGELALAHHGFHGVHGNFRVTFHLP
jgi:hypothetical protein